MKGKTAFNAMEGIDPRYILEAAPDAVIRKGSKAPYLRILAVAATVAALIAVAVLGAGIMKQSGENPPVVPPVEDSQDAQTPAEGEGETAAPADGSYATDLYTVTEIDGKHYISFADGNEKPNGGNSGGNSAIVVKGMYFDSLEEMKNKFLNGKLTVDEVQSMKAQFTLTDKGFEIPDMTNLYDGILPEGWELSYVYLYNDYYSISFLNPETYDAEKDDFSGESGSISFFSDEAFNNDYQYYYTLQLEKVKDGLLEDQTEFYGIPCKAYEYQTAISKIKSVFLDFEYNDCSFQVLMNYCMEHEDEEKVNQTIPYIVHMYGDLNGRRFKVTLSGLENEPNLELLASFGIKPLEPMTAAPAETASATAS
jgi:hypothetical protein